MKRKSLTSIFILLLAFSLTACSCKHEWTEATCTAPKTCSLCQKAEGEPLRHSWNDATCTTPKICSSCKETEGKELGHDYKEETTFDYVSAVTTTAQICNRCNNKLESKSDLKRLHNGEYFLMSASEFDARFEYMLITMVEEIRATVGIYNIDYLSFIDEESPDGEITVYLAKREDSDNDKITVPGHLKLKEMTVDAERNIPLTKKDTRESMNVIECNVLKEDASVITATLFQTLDPTVDHATAWKLCNELGTAGSVTHNGLFYVGAILTEDPDYFVLMVGVIRNS